MQVRENPEKHAELAKFIGLIRAGEFEKLWKARSVDSTAVYSHNEHGRALYVTLPDEVAAIEFSFWRHHLTVDWIYVNPELRGGLGLGRQMMRKVEEYARKAGKHYIQLTATRPAGELRQPFEFYRRLGYVLHPRNSRDSIEQVSWDASIEMVKYLTPEGRKLVKKRWRDELKR